MRSSGGLQLRMPAPELPMDLSHSMRGEEQVLLLETPLGLAQDIIENYSSLHSAGGWIN